MMAKLYYNSTLAKQGYPWTVKYDGKAHHAKGVVIRGNAETVLAFEGNRPWGYLRVELEIEPRGISKSHKDCRHSVIVLDNRIDPLEGIYGRGYAQRK